MKITIELTEEQVISILDQKNIEWGLPSIQEMKDFKEKCHNLCEGLRKLREMDEE